MSWGLVAVGVATVGTGAMSANAARRAGAAAARGADAATAETGRQYDQTRADLAPWRTTGAGALNQLASVFGLPTTTPEQFQSQQPTFHGGMELPAGTTAVSIGDGRYDVMYNGQRIGGLTPGGPAGRFTPADGVDIEALKNEQRNQQIAQGSTGTGAPDMSGFFASPGYQFRRDEGMRGVERTAAARGGAFSGNALRALTDFNSNLASNEFCNWFNQLGTLAGIGQTATNQTAAYGADAASQAGRNALFAGDARASGIVGSGNAWGNTLQDLGGLYGYYKRPKTSGTRDYGMGP